MFKYDLHVHDLVGSLCSSASPEEMVRAFAENGMNGFVSTNHFIHGNTSVSRSLPWEERMREYESAYLRAKKEAEKYENFEVLFGFEHGYAGGREVLVYGADVDFLIAHPEIETMPIEKFSNLMMDSGFVVATAHPYRIRPYNDNSVDPAPLFVNAVEVYNAHNNNEENMKAFKYATRNNFLFISGSDTHHTEETTIGKGGIATKRPIKNNKELVSILKAGEYNLIIDGEIIK